MAKKFFVTTAIDYVNSVPHVGHAFEKILADVIARHQKTKGKDVHFLVGTDENAEKNLRAAEKENVPVEKFVEKNSAVFAELYEKLNVDYDGFIRTSADETHAEKSRETFRKAMEKGDVYKGNYDGLYCVGCESFITEKELAGGKCPEHDREPEKISEENYFFRLSGYRGRLIKFVENYVVPEARKNEILSRLKNEELKDLSVTREKVKWGIDAPVPGSHKIYVWFDALINYLSGAEGNWPADVHVVGKAINWFHSVIWPAMLMSTGTELPKKLLVHGYLNASGKKMSKSLGNVINPFELVEKYGTDAVRYSLLKCSVFEDSDYGAEIMKERNDELANKLGNLVSRVAGLIEKHGFREEKESPLPKKLDEKKIESLTDEFRFSEALGEIFSFVDSCNEWVQEKKIWETGDKKALGEIREGILKTAKLLWPFLPETSEKITKRFSAEKIEKGEILFRKIED